MQQHVGARSGHSCLFTLHADGCHGHWATSTQGKSMPGCERDSIIGRHGSVSGMPRVHYLRGVLQLLLLLVLLCLMWRAWVCQEGTVIF